MTSNFESEDVEMREEDQKPPQRSLRPTTAAVMTEQVRGGKRQSHANNIRNSNKLRTSILTSSNATTSISTLTTSASASSNMIEQYSSSQSISSSMMTETGSLD